MGRSQSKTRRDWSQVVEDNRKPVNSDAGSESPHRSYSVRVGDGVYTVGKIKSIRVNDGSLSKVEIDCQLPPLIHISKDCVIKDVDFVRAMLNASRPFVPLKDMSPEQRERMSKQVKAERPSLEDIDAPRL
jgi:hypothetical protein